MCSRCRRSAPAAALPFVTGRAAAIVLAAALAAGACAERAAVEAAPPAPRELRVCSDPNNLPFSNDREEGFENALAELVAAEMGASLRYTWWVQRRGFIRHTLRALECDVVMGVPTTYELVLATRPYYRSQYVFVYRPDRGLEVRSLDDDVLRTARIGVHVIGEDYANPPPAHALAGEGSSTTSPATASSATMRDPTRPHGSSKRSPPARWTWPWSGGRLRATSPRGNRCRSSSCR
jgi:hypothetical protein